MRICALTTKDNPNDYFKKPDEWASYEALTGGRVYSALGDHAYTSSDISYEVERAIDDIIRNDPIGEFVKITMEVPDP